MGKSFLENQHSSCSSYAKDLMRSAFDYFSKNSNSNIILFNNSDNQEEEKIEQIKINESDEMTYKSCVGLYPLKEKGQIYFDYFIDREHFDRKKLFDYIVKSLDYLDSVNGVGIYCLDNLSTNNFLKNKKNIDDLSNKGFKLDAIFCGFHDFSYNPDCVFLLIRNKEKSILSGDEVIISDISGVKDYFTLQKYIDLGGGKIRSSNEINETLSKSKNIGDISAFRDFYESWIECHEDRTLSYEDVVKINEKIISEMGEPIEDSDVVLKYFEYYWMHTVDIKKFRSVELWMTYRMIQHNDYTADGNLYSLKDLVQRKTSIKDKEKHKDKKNTLYLSSWISEQEASNLGKTWWIDKQPLSYFKICLTKRDEFNYRDKYYQQYSVNTDLVLPEYLEYLFLSYAVSQSLHLVIKKYLKDPGPDNIDGYFLTDQEHYNNLVIKLPSIFEQNRRVKTYKVIKEIKKNVDQYLNYLLDIEDSGYTEKRYSQLVDISKKINLISEENSEITKYTKDHENEKIEFKSTWSMNLKNQKKEKDEKFEKGTVLKTICAFFNTKGGTLLVGISDEGKILGIDEEVKTHYSQNYDKFKMHVLTRLDKFFGADRVTPRIKLEIVESGEISGNKKILILHCEKDMGTYLDNEFYVRQNGRTVQLLGKEIINYIERNKNLDSE
jgi:hypothetical protein